MNRQELLKQADYNFQRGNRALAKKYLLDLLTAHPNDVPAWMLGRIVGRYPVHHNAVIVVQIEDGGLGATDEAMLYHEREFLRPGEPA